MRKNIKLLRKIKSTRYKDSKVGLHCHCELTPDALVSLLKKAKRENVKYLAITNHRNLKIYTQVLPEMSTDILKEFEGISLIPSIELPAHFEYTNLDNVTYGIETHILGYGLDISKEKLLDEFVSQKYCELDQEQELKRLIKIGHDLGLNFQDEDVYLDITDGNRRFAGRAFMQALMKNMDNNFNKEKEENPKKLPFELRTNWGAFQNRCVKDINNPFYLDLTALNPSTTQVINLIHQMGGQAYLAHPSGYFSKIGNQEQISKAYANVIEFVKQFMKKHSPMINPDCHIDGLEIYHPSYLNNIELFSKMKNLVKLHRLRTSGGTDLHVGTIKTNQDSVSSDSMGKNIVVRKLKKFEVLKKASIRLLDLKSKSQTLKENQTEEIEH